MESDGRWDYEVDVAVVGGGGCGLMTALQVARHGGRQVAVFEKSFRSMSNTQISSGSIAAGGTRFQEALGIADSPERHAEDVLAKNHGGCDRDMLLALCRAAPRYVEWLADALGHPVEVGVDMPRVGHSVPRLHADRGRRGGGALVSRMRAAAEAAEDVAVLDNTPGTGLVVSDGEVVGVTVFERPTIRRVRARHTVLACDGFGADRAMRETYLPDFADAPYVGVEGNTGDGIRWGLELGGVMDHSGSYQGHGHVVVGHGTRLNPAIPLLGGIVLDVEGRRFAREDQGYSEFAAVVLAQPRERAIEIWDERIEREVANSELMRDSAAAGAYQRFPDWESLAGAFGLDPRTVLASWDEYRRGAADGRDRHGREVFAEPLEPPLYAAQITGALAHTQGGLRVDRVGRVVRADGAVIPGLFAGGGTAAGVSGDGAAGYLSGNGLLSALGLGYLIGNHIAQG